MSGVVCAICYEDLKPGGEYLQAVSGCGHVFHELCFQQWLEYCHLKPSCPVCKLTFTKGDVNRLYFLSSEENQTKACSSQGQHDEVLEAKVRKLANQVSVAQQALELNKQQLKELEDQLAMGKVKLEQLESARADAVGDRDRFREWYYKAQEDLNKCVAERSKLLEKNTSLAKELAAMKLNADIDIDEGEIQRLATVGQGRNKEDIIDTLTRSLIIRNKNYKDLLTKCTGMATGERNAEGRAVKASEQLKKLKIRVQELEKALESKENKELRILKQRSEQSSSISGAAKQIQVEEVDEGPSKHNLEQKAPVEAEDSLASASSSLLNIPIRREIIPPRASSPPVLPGDFPTTSSPKQQSDNQTTRKRVYATSISAGARGFQHIKSSSDNGSFILTGADGRGGRVTVLKPPKHLGIRTSTISAPRQVKRCKPTTQTGTLSIQNFFEREE